jgi:chromosomal replication initiator protein
LELPSQLELTHAWREICSRLRAIVGESNYDIWLAELKVGAWDGRTLTLRVPAAVEEWAAKRYGRVVESSVRAVLGAAVEVVFAGGPGAGADPASRAGSHEPAATEPFNPRYSFEQFIIGDGNRLAHAAALAVAELPGQAYNPLFLHAPPGLGKTHLLHAIGNYVVAFGGGSTVRYTTVEAFTNHFIAAINARSVDTFKHVYRNADVLLIDDVQFLASKARTEEEFFHTFNAVYESGRQLVLTCDRLPRQLINIEERLRERFESGLVAHLHPPDFATRVAILRKRAALDHVELADRAVLELIAERVTDNIRSLEGSLIRIVAYHSLTGHSLDLALAREVLDEIHPAAGDTGPTIPDIQATVASFYELSVDELVSASRTARITWPRQIAIHLARKLTEASLEEIGRAFGGRNHATVVHACKRVSNQLLGDQQAAGELDKLLSSLTASGVDRGC